MQDRESIARELAEHGLRATRQRIALLGLLRALDHPTAIELHQHLAPEDRGMSRKTVYEVLSSFVRVGLAACVTEGGEPYRYEGADDPHYHARCRECDRLFDLPSTAEPHIRDLTKLPSGFRLEGIAVTLLGTCSSCRRGTRNRSRTRQVTGRAI